MELMGLGLLVLGLVIVGIVYHAETSGVGFYYPAKEKFDIGGWQEQDRADRHAHYLKAEKIFYANELKLAKAEATAKKYKIRRGTDFLPFAIIKNALFHSKAKMKRVRPHTARKLTAGRRKNDGKSGLLDFGLATCGIAFIVMVFFMPTVVIPSYQPQEVVKVVEYAQPKTAEQIAEIQKKLSVWPEITTAESQKVLRKSDKAKHNAEPTTTIELY